MNISAPFIKRPIGTSLLAAALLMAGALAFNYLPVAPLPQVEFPVISVGAGLPGASPETMASAVATPLERQFGRIAGITEMTSTSSLGSTSITMQFGSDNTSQVAIILASPSCRCVRRCPTLQCFSFLNRASSTSL
jgi:multidrug efflux pump